jgi:hypothetical protein
MEHRSELQRFPRARVEDHCVNSDFMAKATSVRLLIGDLDRRSSSLL